MFSATNKQRLSVNDFSEKSLKSLAFYAKIILECEKMKKTNDNMTIGSLPLNMLFFAYP